LKVLTESIPNSSGDVPTSIEKIGPPTPSFPFIFFHLRKCGGSAFRKSVARSSERLNLTSFIPCNEGSEGNIVTSIKKVMGKRFSHSDSCNNYHLDLALGSVFSQDLSVIAGHFYWDSIYYLGGVAKNGVMNDIKRMKGDDDTSPKFSCLILVRHPLQRFLSCYTERFQYRSGLPLQQLSISSLHHILVNWTDSLHGCNNEIARWISPSSGWGDKYINEGKLSDAEKAETKRRMDQCVIVDLTYNQTLSKTVLNYFFPWILDYDIETSQGNGHHSNHVQIDSLPLSHQNLIMSYNKLDLELYEHGLANLHRQMDYITNQHDNS
jgi:hypothetical protein